MLSLKEEREERQQFYERERSARETERREEREWRTREGWRHWIEIASIIVLVPIATALANYIEHRYEAKSETTQKEGTIPGTVVTKSIEPTIANPRGAQH